MKFFVAVALLVAVAAARQMAVSQEMIDQINAANAGWKAEANPISMRTHEDAVGLLGVPKEEMERRDGVYMQRMAQANQEPIRAPESFDARTNWPNCPTIQEIRNQRHCGSCWAFGAAEAMSDRYCVFYNSTVRLSTQDLTSCSESFFIRCGSCNGGRPGCAWSYWASKGIVTEPCYSYVSGLDPSSLDTPKCENRCVNSSTLEWSKDKHLGENHKTISGETAMMNELVENGPFETAFTVYEDFMGYKSGIYKHITGSEEGGHAVKVVGYGVENGEKFWIVANSWDYTWGENGFFRILRGKNECGFESEAWCGVPKKF